MKNDKCLMGWLAGALVWFCLIAGAMAETETVDGITWGYTSYYSRTDYRYVAEVTNASPASGAIVIPDTLGGYPVTTIEDSVFEGSSNLTSVTIPDSVTWLGYYVFKDCVNLTSLTIPPSVTHIGGWAFYRCPGILDTETIPGVTLVDGWVVDCDNTLSGDLDLTGVRGIVDQGFSGCSKLTGVTLGPGLRGIGQYAFSGCSGLTDITIPAGVAYIGFRAFEKCSGLKNVTIGKGAADIGGGCFKGAKR